MDLWKCNVALHTRSACYIGVLLPTYAARRRSCGAHSGAAALSGNLMHDADAGFEDWRTRARTVCFRSVTRVQLFQFPWGKPM